MDFEGVNETVLFTRWQHYALLAGPHTVNVDHGMTHEYVHIHPAVDLIP